MQLSKKRILQNRKEYFNKAIMCDIRLVIVGQDAFPNHQNEIPFCKETFELLSNSCFKAILNSFDTSLECVSHEFKNPKELMFYFLENGVLFLNLSYTLLSKAECKPDELKKSLLINKKLLNKVESGDKYFIKLGKSNPGYFNSLANGYRNSQKETLVHPSFINKYRPKIKEEWNSYWGVPGYLKAVLFDLNGTYINFKTKN